MTRPTGFQMLRLPRPPKGYDERDQTETRRLLEEALSGPTDSVAISVADSKAVSCGVHESTMDSRLTSAGF